MTHSISPPFPFPEMYPGHWLRYRHIDRLQAELDSLATQRNLDGILLTAPENFCWFTAGGDWRNVLFAQTPLAAIFLAEGHRLLVSLSSLTPELLTGELAGLGFQLKQREFPVDFEGLLLDLCRGRRVGSDTGFGLTPLLAPAIDKLRQSPSDWTHRNMIELATEATNLLQQASRAISPGVTASAATGQCARLLLEHQLFPVQVHVMADEQILPHSARASLESVINRRACLFAITRFNGLHHVLLRNIACHALPANELQAWRLAQELLAERIAGTHAGSPFAEVETACEQRIVHARIPDWQISHTCWQLGYRHPERWIGSTTVETPEPGTWLYLETRVGPFRCGQTYSVGMDLLPEIHADWPLRTIIASNGLAVDIPEMLQSRGGNRTP